MARQRVAEPTELCRLSEVLKGCVEPPIILSHQRREHVPSKQGRVWPAADIFIQQVQRISMASKSRERLGCDPVEGERSPSPLALAVERDAKR